MYLRKGLPGLELQQPHSLASTLGSRPKLAAPLSHRHGTSTTIQCFNSPCDHGERFSVRQLSATASIAISCQAVSPAFWGSLADRLGPGQISLSAAVLFFVGYTSLAYLVSGPADLLTDSASTTRDSATASSWVLVTLAYSLCGAASAASYFAAITASTRAFTSRPGLSIAGPSSLFGLSPLLLSYLGTRLFSRAGNFEASAYLGTLAAVTTIVNSLGAVALQRRAIEPDAAEESTALLDTATGHSHSFRPARHAGSVARFLTEPAVWLLGFVVLLSAGPADMTIASIGTVADVQYPGRGIELKARQVQLISIANTIARLTSGWLSDCLFGPSWGGRLSFLAAASALLSIISLWAAADGGVLWVLSLFTGVAYGTMFTLAPSLVATVWPIEDFGRNYGIISCFAATGNFMFTMLFGMLFDQRDGLNSVRLIYALCGTSEVVAIVLSVVLSQLYWISGRP